MSTKARRSVSNDTALFGLGYWGKNIFRNLVAIGALRTVCDSNPDVLQRYAPEHRSVQFTDEPENVLSDPSIRSVFLATPAAQHAEFAIRALEAGKDVFVEKPLGLTLSDGRRVVERAKTLGRILMVGHILHYHPAVETMKNLIHKGVLGTLRYIYSNRLNLGKIRTEENIMWSFAPHDISLILSLAGTMPTRMTASGGAYVTKGIVDTTVTTMEFPDALKAHVFVSWLHPFKEQKLVVVGSRSMLVFDDMTQEKLFLYRHEIDVKDGVIPVSTRAPHEIVPVPSGEPLRNEIEHFLKCVVTREQPLTDGDEGLRVLSVLETANRSLMHDQDSTGHEFAGVYVHESSFVDDGVSIGKGTKIWHFSHVQRGAKIGMKCVLGQNVNVANNVTIGNLVKIQNNVSVYEGVTLEDYVFCGPSMVFTNILNPRSKYPQVGSRYYIKTLVREGASLGANCTVVCGITIGRFAFVAAGAVVTKDVPDFALVAGSPARIVGWMSEAGQKLSFGPDGRARCDRTGKTYRLRDGIVEEIQDA